MATPPDKPLRPAPPDPLYPSDLIPLPDVREESSDSAWATWSALSAKQNANFADTAPASIPMPLLPKGDRRYATTVPSALSSDRPAAEAARRAPVGKRVMVSEVMVEVRRNNRLCPQPTAWQRLYELLPDKKQGPQGWQPQPPVSGAAWSATPALAKRMCLRDHIEWADSHGCLAEVLSFLKELPEEQWHHMAG